jgi:hypothetical protein
MRHLGIHPTAAQRNCILEPKPFPGGPAYAAHIVMVISKFAVILPHSQSSHFVLSPRLYTSKAACVPHSSVVSIPRGFIREQSNVAQSRMLIIYYYTVQKHAKRTCNAPGLPTVIEKAHSPSNMWERHPGWVQPIHSPFMARDSQTRISTACRKVSHSRNGLQEKTIM